MKLSIMVRVQNNSVTFELSEATSVFALTVEEALAFAESIAHAATLAKIDPVNYENASEPADLYVDAEAPPLAACEECGCETSGEAEDNGGNSVPLCFSCYESRSLQTWKDFIAQIKEHCPNAPMVALDSNFPVSEAPANGLFCPQCGEPQFITPNGVFCVNLHEDRGVFK